MFNTSSALFQDRVRGGATIGDLQQPMVDLLPLMLFGAGCDGRYGNPSVHRSLGQPLCVVEQPC